MLRCAERSKPKLISLEIIFEIFQSVSTTPQCHRETDRWMICRSNIMLCIASCGKNQTMKNMKFEFQNNILLNICRIV